MKQTTSNIVISLYTSLFAAILLIDASGSTSWMGSLSSTLKILGSIPIVGYLAITYIPISTAKAYKSLYTKAKMRGYWHHKTLDEQISNKFKKSGHIKLKLSRGYHLFLEKSNIFYRCLNSEIDLDLKEEDKITMKILLIYPCIKSTHIKQRTAINLSRRVETITNDEILTYTKKGLDTLVELYSKDLENNHFIIHTKYYGEPHVKWRYYIFDDELLYLSYYDDQSIGTDLEMFKIYKGEKSLYRPFNTDFDEIWEDITTHDSISYIKNHYAVDKSLLTDCSQCSSKEICKKLKEEYLPKIKTIENKCGIACGIAS
ncbi:MAG: hypothetical protein WA130_13265 [Candidatus Methanoperedens sp.]